MPRPIARGAHRARGLCVGAPRCAGVVASTSLGASLPRGWNEMRYAEGHGSRPRKLSWSREKWLHRPTQEVVDNSDPRSRTWLLIGTQANIEQGYYRRELDMNTARSAEPTFVATWHPNNGPVVTLVRAHEHVAYLAHVRHFQANFRDLPH
jgi:hypothetical protein